MNNKAKDIAKIEIEKLVNRFEAHYDEYMSKDYKEARTRKDFIDPFFKALGWDMDNENGYSEFYRDVIQEPTQIIEEDGLEKAKAPDYAFRIGNGTVFFVESKKPSVVIKDDVSPAYQIRRYGWNASLPISIVTDFEEFAIYDCSKKPNKSDKPTVARLKYFTFRDYVLEFDFLWDTFSRENVKKGGFDKFAKSDTSKKGTTSVDNDFLLSLDNWRTQLASSISLRNKDLDEDEINFAVQQTIDRIIFIRITEDRGIEKYGQLKKCLSGENYYQNLFSVFVKADAKYNSGLFDLKKDKVCKTLVVDNKVVKSIINDLYYPQCPYEFKIMPIEILGSAYEQFLGKVIRITPAHHAKIEEKPEVRKAGGVFYTPKYIVDYIVKNTVGKLISGKTPKDIEKIKIVDPACGSGSFLIGAYQFLLDFHKNYYQKHEIGKKHSKESHLTPDGNLTVNEKRKILINNIFGVDIDVNAVEVTKLSLLLKCLENETENSVNHQLTAFNERLLPTLENNIKSGNSLIDTDFYDWQLDFGEEKKIKPFNWQKGFPDVFKQGGFDAVIGNPPYVFTRDVDWSDDVKSYFWSKFEISKEGDKSRKNQSGKINLYVLFIIKSTELLKSNGLLSFIIPNGLLRTTTYDTIRKFILEKTIIERIVDLKDGVFAGVTASTIIINLLNTNNNTNLNTLIIDANYKRDRIIDELNCTDIKQSDFLNNVSYTFSLFVSPDEQNLFDKMSNSLFHLKDIVVDIIEGIVAHKKFIANSKISNEYLPMLEGKDVKRYQLNFGGNYVLFDRNKIHRARPNYVWESKKKIVIQRISGGKSPLVCAIDRNKYLAFASTNLLLIKDSFVKEYPYELICALLNSRLWNFYYSKNFSNGSNLTVNISKTFLEMLPLPKKPNKDIVNKISLLVENQLTLNNEIKTISIDSKTQQIRQKIEYNDDKINELIYQLYNLTKDDVILIESY